ncbi:hypothetical protein [Acidovorax sp. SUPP2825]|nr:hypothetical protein [Acidovorax sp. SUPP2825]GKS96922.1 hypothetical protein AVAK2825_20325 [Acidovorax sp. SUPP2825]
MLDRILFVLLYLRNLPGFDGHHIRTCAASRMDLDLIKRRRKPAPRARP